jgi:hypothetical protein
LAGAHVDALRSPGKRDLEAGERNLEGAVSGIGSATGYSPRLKAGGVRH